MNAYARACATALTALLCATAAPSWADRGREPGRRDGPSFRAEQGYRLDSRHRHNRYYPSAGVTVKAPPPGHVIVRHRDDRYYFHGGVWYRPLGPRFIVVTPPFGLAISVLPPFYTTVWAGGIPYYYADGVYYAWRPADRTYVVVEPPKESEIAPIPAEPEQMFAYPRQGQSESQQADDRYECHKWASAETTYDPSRPESSPPGPETDRTRADYRRAMTACLEARGYTVR